jgi:hypothetical protein
MAIPNFNYSIIDRSGTIASGGVAQTLMSPNPNRSSWKIQNLSTFPLYFSTTGTASLSTSVVLPGEFYESGDNEGSVGAISVFATQSGIKFSASESTATATTATFTPIFVESDISGIVSLANTSQIIITASNGLYFWRIKNTSTHNLYFNDTGQSAVAESPGSYRLKPGDSYNGVVGGYMAANVTVLGLVAGQTYEATMSLAQVNIPSGDWGGGGVWGGGGTWNGLVSQPVKIGFEVPYNPARLENVVFQAEIATVSQNPNNTNFTQISAQPNVLGNEIDIFLTNPGRITGTLVRNMFRYPLKVSDGTTLVSGVALLYWVDFGTAPETMYYYTWFPDNSDAPISVSCQGTSAYNMLGFIWDGPKIIPNVYKAKDAEYIPSATVTTQVVYNEQNDANSFVVADTFNINPNQLIQVHNDLVCIRQIDYINSRIYVTPALTTPVDDGDIVILEGLGFPLKRFLKVFCEQLDYMYSRITALLPNRQIDNCDNAFIANFAQYVGLGQIINSGGVADVRAARNQVKSAVALYQIKGMEECFRQLLTLIVGPSYGIQIDYMKDMIGFTNNRNSYNGTIRNDNTVDTNNVQTYLAQGKYGDPARYTPDSSANAIYAPYVFRITIQALSDFDLIPGYTNTILAVIPQFLPVGVNFYLLWDTTQPTLQITGTGFGITFNPMVSTV